MRCFNFQVLAWCGEFNAHNTLWVNETTDNNSPVIEDVLDGNNLVRFGNEVAVTNREKVLLQNTVSTICRI